MYIRCMGVNLDKSKKLWVILLVAVVVAILLITVTFIHVFQQKDAGTGSLNRPDLLKTNTYYAKYHMTVFSNKNQNTYQIKEWYEKKEKGYQFRIETSNEKENFTYVGTDHSMGIMSEGQISKWDKSEISKQTNVMSISTFIEIYLAMTKTMDNQQTVKENCCKLEVREEDQNVNYCVTLNKEATTQCDICSHYKEMTNSGMNISKFELVVDQKKQTPIQYIVYTSGDKSYLDILYDNFEINGDFDEKLFAI